MSNQKLIFFITLGVITAVAFIWFFFFLDKKKTPMSGDTANTLSVWIVGDTTEGYNSIVEGFKKKNPEYASLTIEFKKFPSWSDYHTTILNVLANGNGPDIFVVPVGGDDALKDKTEPLPGSLIDINRFMERYPSFMLDDLMTESEDSNGKKGAALWGIPLGYETLGMYYNKSILPTPPTSWDEMDMLIQNNEQPEIVLFGLGLGPRYIPESADIIASLSSASSYTGLSSAGEGGLRYMKYAHMQGKGRSPENTPEDLYAPRSPSSSGMTMYDLIPEMKTQNGEIELTVYDLFMRGKVGAIFSYPSRIRELELSKKRAGSDTSASLILTAPFPTLGNDEKKSRVLASYWYFAISSKTKNGISAGQFMNYLTTEEAQAKFIESFPTYIAAQTSFVAGQRDTPLSSSFSRARLGNFIVPGEKVYSFQYGIRKEFDSYLHEYMDFTENPPENMLDKIAKGVQCQLDHLRGENMETVCEK